MNAEKLSITLPADMTRMIRQHVESRAYASESDVIREALQLWQDQQSEREQRIGDIRAQVQQAADDPRRITDDQLRRHFDARLAEVTKQHGP